MSRPNKLRRPEADIYALMDPHTMEVRYIGLAVNLPLRMRLHLRESRHSDSPKNKWLRSLGEARPAVCILETVPREDACIREQYWIAHYRRLGADLTNLTAGGESTLGWVPSVETRARIGAANRGRVTSEETKAKLSAIGKAIWNTPEGRASRSRTAPRKPISPEQRHRMTEGLRLAYQDPESKASRARRAHGEQKRGKPGHSPSPETRARQSAALRGRQMSAEQRQRISEAKTGKGKGATFHRRCRKWQAQIICRGQNYYLGMFSTEAEAIAAYKNAARALVLP